jgi:TolA-binding protein
MNCKSVCKLLDEYIDRYCDDATAARVRVHLDKCEVCATEYETRLQLRAAMRSFPVPVRADAQWLKIEAFVLNEIKDIHQEKKVIPFKKTISLQLRVAAVLVLVLFAAIPFIVNQMSNYKGDSQFVSALPQLISSEGMVSLNGTLCSDLNKNLEIGSVIATNPSSQVIIQADSGSRIKLAEKSSVRVKSFSKKNQTFQLEYGAVSVHVTKRMDDQLFSVKTSNAVCEVVGTRFSVQFSGDSTKPTTVLSVKEGCVRFRTNDGTAVLVNSGERCCISGSSIGEKVSEVVEKPIVNNPVSKKSIESIIQTHDKLIFSEKRALNGDTNLSGVNYVELTRQTDSLIEKENFSAALQSIEKIISSSVLKPDQLYDATMKKVRIMKRLQRYQDAAILLESVASGKFRKEYCGNALYQLAIVQKKELKNTEKAIVTLQKYISEHSDGVMISDAYYSLAEILHERADYKGEASVYNQYIESAGAAEGSQRAVYALASLYSKELHDCNRALGLFTHLEKSDPKGLYAEDALFWKANCLNAQGKANLAIAAYKEYLERYPAGRWVMDAKARTMTKNDPGAQVR